MPRHPTLVPLSRDHHRALVEARAARLCGGDAAGRLEAGRRFARFFAVHAVPHFRLEEEELFPLAVPHDGAEPPEPLVRALLDHARLHGLAAEVRAAVERGDVDGDLLQAAGALLEAHVRLEERVLFPLIEQVAGHEGLAALRLHESGPQPAAPPVVADLGAVAGRGVAWSATSDDLNVNLVDWPAGGGVGAHVNAERDVLLVILAGGGEVVVGGDSHAVAAGWAAIVPAGAERCVRAGPGGIRYVSAHLRRPPGIPLG